MFSYLFKITPATVSVHVFRVSTSYIAGIATRGGVRMDNFFDIRTPLGVLVRCSAVEIVNEIQKPSGAEGGHVRAIRSVSLWVVLIVVVVAPKPHRHYFSSHRRRVARTSCISGSW